MISKLERSKQFYEEVADPWDDNELAVQREDKNSNVVGLLVYVLLERLTRPFRRNLPEQWRDFGSTTKPKF